MARVNKGDKVQIGPQVETGLYLQGIVVAAFRGMAKVHFNCPGTETPMMYADGKPMLTMLSQSRLQEMRE